MRDGVSVALLWAVAAAMILSPVKAEPAEAAALQPASAWKIEPTDLACYLTRDFGVDDQAVTVKLRWSLVKTSVRWMVSGPLMAMRMAEISEEASRALAGRVTMTMLPQQIEHSHAAIFGLSAVDDMPYALWLDREAHSFEKLQDDQQILLAGSRGGELLLSISGMVQAVAALEGCIAGQRKAIGWNDDIAVEARPANYAARWVTNLDYPSLSRRNRDKGMVGFLLMVSETGEVSDCHITDPSGFAELDDETCVLMRKRARFHPAKDAEGRAVKSQYHNHVRWQLPR